LHYRFDVFLSQSHVSLSFATKHRIKTARGKNLNSKLVVGFLRKVLMVILLLIMVEWIVGE
jgi:hypothetical protein